jgi:hypothetical protein
MYCIYYISHSNVRTMYRYGPIWPKDTERHKHVTNAYIHANAESDSNPRSPSRTLRPAWSYAFFFLNEILHHGEGANLKGFVVVTLTQAMWSRLCGYFISARESAGMRLQPVICYYSETILTAVLSPYSISLPLPLVLKSHSFSVCVQLLSIPFNFPH